MNKDLYFESVEEFADCIIERVNGDSELFVAVVGKYENIKPLLKEIMAYDFVDFDSIEIVSEDIDDYADEFVLSIWKSGCDIEVGCEKIKRCGEYIDFCGDETYLFEDCSSKIIPLCEDSDLYFVNFDEACGCDDVCCGRCECEYCNDCSEYEEDEDDDIHGFTASKSTDNGYYSYSFYTSDALSGADIRSMLRELGF